MLNMLDIPKTGWSQPGPRPLNSPNVKKPKPLVDKAVLKGGVLVKTVTPAVEPEIWFKAAGAEGMVVNTGVLAFKQPVLVKLSNIPKDTTYVNLDFTTIDARPKCLQSSPTFKHKNDLFTFAICLPYNHIEHDQLQDHMPISVLNKNTVVNVLEVSEEKREPSEKTVVVNLEARLKSLIQLDKPIVVQVELTAVSQKDKLPLKSGSIFILNSISRRYRKRLAKVMNHLFIAERDSSGSMHAQLIFYPCNFETIPLFEKGDLIGQAVLFDYSRPNLVQRCLSASSLQARL